MLAVGDAILTIRAVQQKYEKTSDCRSIEVAAWTKTENPKFFFFFFFPFRELDDEKMILFHIFIFHLILHLFTMILLVI